MRAITLVFLSALLTVPARAQRSALTVSRNLSQLTQQAALIVHGQIVRVRVEPHPQLTNLTTVVVTLRVAETLKGSSEQTLTFRQYVWDLADQKDAAGYRKGQEVLLLLNPVSSYGLTSPAGMEQGRFRILRDAQGNATAVNGYGNVGLFSGIAAEARQRGMRFSAGTAALIVEPRAGPVGLSQLEAAIREFAGGAR